MLERNGKDCMGAEKAAKGKKRAQKPSLWHATLLRPPGPPLDRILEPPNTFHPLLMVLLPL